MDFIIRNFPFTGDENRIEVVKSIYKCLSLNFSNDLVTNVKRVFAKDINNKPLIVEMNTVQSKTEFLGSLKNYNKTHPNNPLATNKLGFAESYTLRITLHCMLPNSIILQEILSVTTTLNTAGLDTGRLINHHLREEA